jgi:hypothetical protein
MCGGAGRRCGNIPVAYESLWRLRELLEEIEAELVSLLFKVNPKRLR